ncbi:MAG: lipoate--protein ligase family protein [Planctomycetes bacterium]|nr:lipoate--protein ligase family protein [Planctomycetota bacterium]
MHLLNLTLPTASENVALDEALLLDSEAGDPMSERLRLWEPMRPMAVLGRSSVAQREVDLEACRRDEVPVVRRVSGGCTILAATGCLMYAVVLSYARRPELRAIHSAHRHVLDALATVLGRCAPGLKRAGTSDLVLDDRKVSGNSLRCQRTHLLYHGTLLYDMPLEWVARYVRIPPREPDYRAKRGHQEFLTKIPATREEVTAAVVDAFDAREPLTQWPQELVRQLVEQRYGVEAWNLQGRL